MVFVPLLPVRSARPEGRLASCDSLFVDTAYGGPVRLRHRVDEAIRVCHGNKANSFFAADSRSARGAEQKLEQLMVEEHHGCAVYDMRQYL